MNPSVNPPYPTLRQISPRLWILESRVVYRDPSQKIRVEVPTGFQTDGASVPRFFWRLFPPLSDYTNAAVVHDFLYVTKGESGKYTRKQSDQIFLNAMEALGVEPWRRKTMYQAVRWFGPRW